MEENSEKSSLNKVQQSILSFVKSKQVKSRTSEDEDETQKIPKHNGSQSFEVRMITLRNVYSDTESHGERWTDLALLLATKIRVKIIPYTQNQNYQKAWYS